MISLPATSTPAPVVVFAYRRPRHLERVLGALRENELASRSTVFIICDGPAGPADAAAVNEVRDVVASVGTGFAAVRPIYRSHNMGLARSIIVGVTELIGQYGEIIVLEDDLVPAPFFLRYMNDALDLYRRDERVISIHAYCYPLPTGLPPTFFLRGADCWGWATWARGWSRFRPNGRELLRELAEKRLTRRLDYDGMYPYTRMLRDQIAGLNDSWAIRWYASALLDGGLTLYPGQSLVRNIGNDGSGRHSRQSSDFDVDLAPGPVAVRRMPLIENAEALAAFTAYFRSIRPSMTLRVATALVRTLRRRLRTDRRPHDQTSPAGL